MTAIVSAQSLFVSDAGDDLHSALEMLKVSIRHTAKDNGRNHGYLGFVGFKNSTTNWVFRTDGTCYRNTYQTVNMPNDVHVRLGHKQVFDRNGVLIDHESWVAVEIGDDPCGNMMYSAEFYANGVFSY